MDLELAGKSVIVTGGASNIGRAITLGFAREGANITLADLDAEQADKVAVEARQLGAAAIQVVPTDVTDIEQVQRMVTTAQSSYGDVDVLINNVGWDQLMFFMQTSPDFWRKVVEINFIGMLNCTHTVLERMVKTGGAIVSISSDASRQGEPKEAVYGAMKAGINSFMKTIARENGRYGVRCNVVCPGVTIPEGDDEIGVNSMWVDKDNMFTEEQLTRIAGGLPLKKLGRPRDVTGAVLFLSSQAAAGYITGQVLSVSGGYSMIG
ncbi:MAG: SDR family oxidoreductase [Pseudomonadales bacterium]|jgi:NAD(P)-dependent dehydrogenase (short-subunit alcohol dehydrogenase family)|nr:SDR family oxidoreductase [Pseudomonadales bacterium]MDP7357931.1 SDR family oxidoreductase [Pseudomonadales bacterium]MDP7595611.1 SDR family oxidoreductase [Pseudomonadales bacterium]HJN50347.1 SDR family oxidoreductase [Pseudomonadales bacterium]|tara:strand:+ start:3917 stop:4711 length:795 start_codon:yes stop_codon:yes gene_type:complete